MAEQPKQSKELSADRIPSEIWIGIGRGHYEEAYGEYILAADVARAVRAEQQAEIEQLRIDQKYAVAGKKLLHAIQGMCEPEVREGDPVDGYIRVYLRQKAEIERLRQENDEVRTAIACAADLMNTWARESSVAECTSPWSGTALRDLVDRLWSHNTREAAEAKEA